MAANASAKADFLKDVLAASNYQAPTQPFQAVHRPDCFQIPQARMLAHCGEERAFACLRAFSGEISSVLLDPHTIGHIRRRAENHAFARLQTRTNFHRGPTVEL
jgi:hypothetical protein